MRGQNYIVRRTLAVWIILLGFIMSPASAYSQQTKSTSWSDVPSYSPATPTYQFRSTSSYNTVVSSSTTFTPLADDPYAGLAKQNGVIRTWNPWDTPGGDDLPIGVVDPPQPIGTPMVLLLMAALYFIGRVCKRRFKKI